MSIKFDMLVNEGRSASCTDASCGGGDALVRSALEVGEDEGDEDGERSCGGGERARLKAAAIARGVDVSS